MGVGVPRGESRSGDPDEAPVGTAQSSSCERSCPDDGLAMTTVVAIADHFGVVVATHSRLTAVRNDRRSFYNEE